MSASPPPPQALAERLEQLHGLDAPAGIIANALRSAMPEGAVRNGLRGRFLGHALHPLLTDVPMGAWTSAVILDLIGGRSSQGAADLLVGVGVVTALPTAVTGWADWSEATIEQRRVGLVHAAANITALGAFCGSLRDRRRGRRTRGKLLSLAGAGLLGVGGYLGGHLAFARGVGVGDRGRDPAP